MIPRLSDAISRFVDRFTWSLVIVSSVTLLTCAFLSACRTHADRLDKAGDEAQAKAAREYWRAFDKEVVR